jgi:hypothetical protein
VALDGGNGAAGRCENLRDIGETGPGRRLGPNLAAECGRANGGGTAWAWWGRVKRTAGAKGETLRESAGGGDWIIGPKVRQMNRGEAARERKRKTEKKKKYIFYFILYYLNFKRGWQRQWIG